MKSILGTLLALSVSALMLINCAAAQTQVITPTESLGDYARNVRKDKKPSTAKKYDNDNLPLNDKLSVVGNAPADTSTPAAATDNSQPAAATQPGDADKKPEVKPGQTPEERQKGYDQWKQKIATQKDHIDLLTRELDVTQREYQLRAAAFYADAGNRLRNSGAWDKEDADYKQKIADKQKALDEAKQQLDDMQEEARKSGVPSSVRE
ncbi:MAG: hypothetical protein ACHP8A_04685 [Terriglobales bacterium]|nr:hypothetical protein [Terriglobales bacterium]